MMMLTQNRSEDAQLHAGITLRVPDMARILIVCENNADTEQLKSVFLDAGLISESANSMTAGCESAKSGRFQVVFSTPNLVDGSWGRLIDVAHRNSLDFELVLLARTFNLNQWLEALQDGAFEVLDVLSDLSKAGETAKSALAAGYLKRFRPCPTQLKYAN